MFRFSGAIANNSLFADAISNPNNSLSCTLTDSTITIPREFVGRVLIELYLIGTSMVRITDLGPTLTGRTSIVPNMGHNGDAAWEVSFPDNGVAGVYKAFYSTSIDCKQAGSVPNTVTVPAVSGTVVGFSLSVCQINQLVNGW
jgi:hypothetical protein